MKKRCLGLFLCYVLSVTLFPSVYAEDSWSDFNAVRDRVNQIQSNLPAAPGVNEEEQRGLIGGVIARIFDTSGVIYSRYLQSVSGIFGNTSGLVPRWNGSSFEPGVITDLGDEVRINGDITADNFYKTDGSSIGGKFIDGVNPLDAVYIHRNVGIGTNYPVSKLDIRGNTRIEGNLYLSSGTLNGDSITDGTIDTTEIQENSLTSYDLANNSVGDAELIDNPSVSNLRLYAGSGRGIGFWNGSDNYKIYMSSQSDETWGGRLDTTSDYNMYFKMDYGTNRGFVFKSGTGVVAQIEGNGNIRSTGYFVGNGNYLTNINGDNIVDGSVDSSEIENDSITEEDISDSFIARNSDTLDGIDSSSFIRSDSDVVLNGKLGVHEETHAFGANDYNLELFAPNSGDRNSEISLRFHQANQYWYQIRAKSGGFWFTGGSNSTLASIHADGEHITNISGDNIIDGSIDSSEIEDDSITASDLADNSVGDAELIDEPTIKNLKISSGEGNGVKFWSSDNYKISMGNSSEYKYGYVGDYSIKMNMNNDEDRGWTWGVAGLTPRTSLDTDGNFQTEGLVRAEGGFNVGGTTLIDGSGWLKGDRIEQESIDGSEIENGTINSADIAADAIGSGKIEDESIKSEDIKNDTITSSDIKDKTIDTADIAADAIGSGKIKDDSIESEDIKNGTITSDDIKNGTIDTADIKDGSIGGEKLKDTVTFKRVKSKEYCDEDGNNCKSSVWGTWGEWENMEINVDRIPNAVYQNTGSTGLMISGVGRETGYVAVSSDSTVMDDGTFTSFSDPRWIKIGHFIDKSGESTSHSAIIPPGSYYTMYARAGMQYWAELRLPY